MRWKELSEGKTSDQLMSVLLEEIQGDQGEGGSTAEFFEGQVSLASRATYTLNMLLHACSESQMARHVLCTLHANVRYTFTL